MSFLGQDDGYSSLQAARLLSETKVAEARRAGKGMIPLGWWPSAGAVARVFVISVAAIVLMGWLLTGLNR